MVCVSYSDRKMFSTELAGFHKNLPEVDVQLNCSSWYSCMNGIFEVQHEEREDCNKEPRPLPSTSVLFH